MIGHQAAREDVIRIRTTSTRARVGALLGAAVLVALIAATPASAAVAPCGGAGAGDALPIREIDNLVVLTGRAAVGTQECVAGDVVIFNGPAAIDGTVGGNVVVFNGPTRIAGAVLGDVTSFSGDVVLEDGARVAGNLTTGTDPEITGDAVVGGRVERVRPQEFGEGLRVAGFFTRIAVWLAVTISALVLGLILLAFAPRAAETTARVARRHTGASIGWGAALFFLVPIVAVVALATLVGIPLGLVTLFGLGLLYSVGYLAASFVVGRAIVKSPARRFAAFLVGWAILRALAIIPVVGGIVWFCASVFGLGALAVAARRSNRPPIYSPSPDTPLPSAEPPPPLPDAPPPAPPFAPSGRD